MRRRKIAENAIKKEKERNGEQSGIPAASVAAKDEHFVGPVDHDRRVPAPSGRRRVGRLCGGVFEHGIWEG